MVLFDTSKGVETWQLITLQRQPEQEKRTVDDVTCQAHVTGKVWEESGKSV
jgi:hypothetical protein